MKIVVGSKNPVKKRAAESAFAKVYPDRQIEVHGIAVPSGVAAQPVGDSDTRAGAQNRARNACEQMPDGDFFVGFEGGVVVLEDTLTAFAWVSVVDRAGRSGSARTVTLPLPQAVRTLMDEGLELGEANDRVFATVNSKQQGGAFGLLTNGLYTRESVYTEAVVVALVPIVSPLYEPS